MAKLITPEKAIRLKKGFRFIHIGGTKWHFVDTYNKRLTVCKVVIIGSRPRPPRWEVARIEDVKPKDICKICLGGMVAV